MASSSSSSSSTVSAALPPPSFSSLSTSEIQYLVSGSFENFRIDGRTNVEYRPYSCHTGNSFQQEETGPFLASNGSSRISLPGSSTDILCSIKADLIQPSPLQPDEGIIELHVDTLPSFSGSTGSSQKNQRIEEMELKSILNDLFLPYIVNKKDLCVIISKYVWRLHVDLVILCCDGCVVDVCSMVIRSALQNLILPTVTPVTKYIQPIQGGREYGNASSTRGKVSDDILLDGDVKHAVRLSSSSHCPIIVTIYLLEKVALEKESSTMATSSSSTTIHGIKIQKRGPISFIVDARSEEEVCACAKVSVGVDPDGNICGIYTYGNSSSLNSTPSSIARGSMGTIPVATLHEITKVAVNASKTVFTMLQQNEKRRESSSNSRNNLIVGQVFMDILKGCFELR